jgi:hypothetical protein
LRLRDHFHGLVSCLQVGPGVFPTTLPSIGGCLIFRLIVESSLEADVEVGQFFVFTFKIV